MAYKVSYAGIPLHDYVDILNVKRSVLPSRENFVKDIPSQHGSFYMGYKYAPREITLECLLKANSKEEFIENVRELAFILDVNVPTKMIIDDEKDKYCYAILDGDTDLDKLANNSQFELKMICYDPYLYAIKEDFFQDEPISNNARSVTIQNEGSTPTYPIIDIGFTKEAHFVQCTDSKGRTVLVGTPPDADKSKGTFDPEVLKDPCEVLTDWVNVGNIIDDGIVDGDIVVNGGGYGFTCTNYGSNAEGWHGGARRRNLDSLVKDFRVEVKMEHSSKGDLNGVGSGSSSPSTGSGSSVNYEITANPSLRIRKSRSTSSTKLGNIPKGKVVAVSDIQNNWGKVTYNGITGYIYMQYTKKQTTTTSNSTNGNYKTTANLRIRKSRGTKYATLTTIPKGTTVTVTDIKNNWGKVTYRGYTGYSYMKYMTKVSGKSIRADEVSEYETREDRMGKIEVYGFDQNGNKLFKMCLKDTSEYYEHTYPEIQIGSKVELTDDSKTPNPKTTQVQDEKDETKTVTKKIDSGSYGDWNDFVGWFTIERKDNKWKCKVEKHKNSGEAPELIQSATLSDSSYPTGSLANIVVWFGKYKENLVVDSMNVNEIRVTNIGNPPKEKENKPLFKNGDSLIIDFRNQSTRLLRGGKTESMMQYLDIGSEFFDCPIGESQIAIRSDDTNIDVGASITKRWI